MGTSEENQFILPELSLATVCFLSIPRFTMASAGSNLTFYCSSAASYEATTAGTK